MQVILKVKYKDKLLKIAQRSTFQKAKPYGLGHIKKELIKQGEWYGHDFPLIYLGYILVILFLGRNKS